MNSALLKSPKEAELMNNNMFGKFRGFTLKPLPKENGTNVVGSNVAYVHPVTKTTIDDSTTVPSRSAPPPPVPKVPEIVRSQTQIKPVKPIVHRTNTTVSAPALPPLNPGSTARPIISSPILEASTCTAKELMSPLKNSKFPVRPAPIVPSEISDYSGNSSPDVLSISSNKEKKSKEGTLHRIASFLKKEDKSSSQTLPRNPSINSKMNKIDKEKLKNIEISAPIQQSDASDSEYDAPGVSRTQSMRSPTGTAKRPIIQTFGSMRQPTGSKRPSSIVGSRPKSPPPPRPLPPAITGMKIPGLPGYQNPPAPKKIDRNDYDDCEAVEIPLAHISEENSPSSPDNIYAVIEELPSSSKLLKSPPTPSNAATSKSASVDSMGLLGEIVSEIENRNFDSIYSASTLKKKKGDPKKIITEPAYANTSEIDIDSESEYSNSNIKSNASTTSSGYLRPSAINTPIARVAPTKPENPKNTFSSFKTPTTNAPTVATYKPYSAALNRPGPYASSFKSNSEDKNSKIDANKNVRTRSPSPKGLPRQNSNPKSIVTAGVKKPTTSPDVVTSAIKTRPPDVVANGFKPKTPQKPQVAISKIDSGLKIMTRQNSGDKLQDKPKKWQATRTKSQEVSTKTTPKPTETVLNNKLGSNSKILTAAARPGPGKASNVASLQQKFETSANS